MDFGPTLGCYLRPKIYLLSLNLDRCYPRDLAAIQYLYSDWSIHRDIYQNFSPFSNCCCLSRAKGNLGQFPPLAPIPYLTVPVKSLSRDLFRQIIDLSFLIRKEIESTLYSKEREIVVELGEGWHQCVARYQIPLRFLFSNPFLRFDLNRSLAPSDAPLEVN